MAKRPEFIDLRSQSHEPLGSNGTLPRPLPSPRLHLAGEVPPELSPLDAFAAQSRLLAKQLEQGHSNNGKRISRLPPLTIENSLKHARPGYFRSVSAEPNTGAEYEASASGPATKPEIETGCFRPVSVYPHVGNIPPSVRARSPPRFDLRDDEQPRGRERPGPHHNQDVNTRMKRHNQILTTQMEQSPSTADQIQGYRRQDTSPSYLPARPSIESTQLRDHSSLRTPDLSGARGYDSRTLAPPRSPFAQKALSINSSSVDDSDEDNPGSLGGLSLSESRKFSTSSGLSNSPISPLIMQSIPRSPSVSSDFSAAESHLSRPTFNFSRPLSRASGPPLETPSRQASSDSQPFVFADDTIHTPVSMHSEEFLDSNQASTGAPSYVYSRFSLPRGKMLQRSSGIFQESVPPTEFRWEQPPIPYSNVQTYGDALATPPSPPSRPSTSSLGRARSTSIPEASDVFRDRISQEQNRGRQGQSRSNAQDLNLPNTSSRGYPAPSIASGSTLKAPSQHSLTPSADLSAEEHVTKGIDCHERGSLNESTYHLRIAARQNHPTGMLLYALACRHGWGMRPNQREGVQWLRKAADYAILEVADDEDLSKGGKPVDIMEQKTRKAQFALSIYELGVSHMNGWGIEQDKVLALRCFEIAGGMSSLLSCTVCSC